MYPQSRFWTVICTWTEGGYTGPKPTKTPNSSLPVESVSEAGSRILLRAKHITLGAQHRKLGSNYMVASHLNKLGSACRAMDKLSVTYKPTWKTKDPLSVSSHSLWVDTAEKRIYNWGGDRGYVWNDLKDDEDEDDEYNRLVLMVFDPDGEGSGAWSTEEPKNPDTFNNFLVGSEAGHASCGGTGYHLGGIRRTFLTRGYEDETPSTGLVSFNFETKEWSNDSSVQFNSPHGTYTGGRAVCGNAADSGPLLFFLGGDARAGERPRLTRESVRMNNITFYDTKTRVWRWQLTSGDTPAPRQHFCAVGMQGPGGTYDM